MSKNKKSMVILSLMSFLALGTIAPNAKPVIVNADSEAATPGWSNVNQIHFTDNYSLFNSGIAELQVGKEIHVKAVVNYSGDKAPIGQSLISFENVGSSININYDGTITFDLNKKQAFFEFSVILVENITAPQLFTVKVSDRLADDQQHLTPYSQTQTIIQSPAPPSSSHSTESTTTESTTTDSNSSTTDVTTSDSRIESTTTSESNTSATESTTSESNYNSTDSTTEDSKTSSTDSTTTSTSSTDTTTTDSSNDSTESSTTTESNSNSTESINTSSTTQTLSADSSTDSKKVPKQSVANTPSKPKNKLPETGETTSRFWFIGSGITLMGLALFLLKKHQ